MVSPDGRSLAAISELAGANEGRISAYSIDASGSEPVFLNAQTTAGYTPAHLSFDGTGAFAAAINYGDVPPSAPPGASVTVYRRAADGSLSAPVASATHTGTGADPQRQDRPHAHCVRWTPDNRFVVVADLGIDRLMVYAFDAATGGLTLHNEVELPPGSGPRHFAFHPDGKHVYVVNELSFTVASFGFDAANAGFTLLGVESTQQAGAPIATSCSAIQIAPGGKQLFAGNRGADTIVRFDIGADHIARAVETTPCGGRTPRDFAFDPSGDILAVANQDGDNITLFRFDRGSGSLSLLTSFAIGSPTSIAFAAAR